MHLQGRARRWVLRRGLCSAQASRTVWLHLLVSAFCETARPANTGTAQGSPHRARHSSDQGLQGWGCQGCCHTAPQALPSHCPADAVGPGCVSAASSPPSLPLPKSRWILHRPTPAPGAPSYLNLLHQDPSVPAPRGVLEPCPALSTRCSPRTPPASPAQTHGDGVELSGLWGCRQPAIKPFSSPCLAALALFQLCHRSGARAGRGQHWGSRCPPAPARSSSRRAPGPGSFSWPRTWQQGR